MDSEEIFDHILNKALNNRMVDPGMVFIDGTHIKASTPRIARRCFAAHYHNKGRQTDIPHQSEATHGNPPAFFDFSLTFPQIAQ